MSRDSLNEHWIFPETVRISKKGILLPWCWYTLLAYKWSVYSRMSHSNVIFQWQQIPDIVKLVIISLRKHDEFSKDLRVPA